MASILLLFSFLHRDQYLAAIMDIMKTGKPNPSAKPSFILLFPPDERAESEYNTNGLFGPVFVVLHTVPLAGI